MILWLCFLENQLYCFMRNWVIIGLSSERPMVMHAVKREKCQILRMGPFRVAVECAPAELENFFASYMSLVSKVVEYTPQYLLEFWENLLFHVLSNDACKFAINLFPIMWGPFENVHLLYFLLQIQIWNGCNVINIAANPIKDINVNLSFLSSWWTVVEYTPPDWKIFLLHLWV